MKNIELINRIIKKRYYIIIIFVLLFFLFVIFNLFNYIFFKQDKYQSLLEFRTGKIYIGQVGERGKIYDRNGNLLVGNISIRIITYIKKPDITINKELELAKIISNNINLDYEKVSVKALKDYYFIKNKKILGSKLSEKIKNKYRNREISYDEYNEYFYKLIKEEDINNMKETEKRIAYVYNLMNKGYKNAVKIIKNENVTDEEYNFIEKNKLHGFNNQIRYERYYPYGEVLKGYLGTIGAIPEEELEKRLRQGYSMDEIVGKSYLEKQYEEYLRGQNETYIVNAKEEKIIVSKAKPGKDIKLTIDINLQQEIENIVFESVKKAKKEPNTNFYNRSYVIVSNPKTGEILASVAKGVIKTNKNYEIMDYITDLTNISITPGSIVKGASHLVGYENNAISFGYKVNDSCIKIKNTPRKCSWKRLGKIDDLLALKYSSNYYQYLIAIKIGNGNYSYNKSLELNPNAFKIYRSMYNSFGLGVKTGIDLPFESIGYVGKDTNPGSVLDYPIGQYETYTPMQIMQYINTLAMSGLRIAPHYLLGVYEKDKLYLKYKPKSLGKVNAKKENIERVRLGLQMVLESGGTAYGYIDKSHLPAGKTGTAQGFLDTNGDGKIDTETMTTTFGAYAPYNDPNISFVVISPHVSSRRGSYISSVNKKIAKLVSNLYFKKYN